MEAATRKKRVGKISWAQAQANQRLVRNMRNRLIKMAEAKKPYKDPLDRRP